jgi:hypothetical protein
MFLPLFSISYHNSPPLYTTLPPLTIPLRYWAQNFKVLKEILRFGEGTGPFVAWDSGNTTFAIVRAWEDDEPLACSRTIAVFLPREGGLN